MKRICNHCGCEVNEEVEEKLKEEFDNVSNILYEKVYK